MMLKKAFVLLTFVVLSGCQGALDLPPVETSADTHKSPPATEQRRLAVSGGIFDIPRGELYVAYPFWHWSVPNVNVGWYICNSTLKHRLARSQGYWNEDDNIFGSWPEETATHVESALSGMGYNVKQHKKSYFADKVNRPQADLLLSMRITDIKFNMCHIYPPFGLQSMNRAGGNGVVTVEWEVYDTIREKILGAYTTQGYAHIDEPLQAGEKALLIEAVEHAAQNLGRTDWFHRLMTTADPVDLLPKTTYTPLKLKTRARVFHQPIRQQFAFARKAVISVRAEGEWHGSGFFINNEGYALTTAGMVGGAGQVQIMDVNGTKYAAKVLRTDVRRDVALIKADIKDNTALPISSAKEIDLTEDVYAIGTPFGNSYRATITKGIVAANRYQVHQGLSFIQASVPTAPGYSGGPLTDEYGNVIGLAKTISDEAGETNFMLFIPIKEALKALNITLETEEFN